LAERRNHSASSVVTKRPSAGMRTARKTATRMAGNSQLVSRAWWIVGLGMGDAAIIAARCWQRGLWVVMRP
jgi:hypothetical protein